MTGADLGRATTPPIEVGAPAPLGAHDRALYDAGQALIRESLSVGREYCRSMIAVCSGAIPLYLGILAFVLPDESGFGIARAVLLMVPVAMYLIASVIFAYGDWPRTEWLSVDVLEEIEAVRERAIDHRLRAARAGFVVFATSTMLSAMVVIASLATQ